MSGNSQVAQAQAIAAQNQMARQLINSNAVLMTQQISASTIVPANIGNTLNIPPRNVGLIKGFYIQIIGTITNPAGNAAVVPTELNLANVLSQVIFTDFANYVRISTTGWHLTQIASVKQRRPFGSAFTTDDPRGYGSNMPLNVIPASIAAGAAGNFECWYYVPLAYGGLDEKDLRGAVFASLVNATANLQLTINPNVAVTSTGDQTLAIVKGSAAGTVTGVAITSATVKVFQHFLDQLPQSQQGPVLPLSDLARVYELKTTNLTGLAQGQDFPIPYTNFRDFLSTMIIFDNGGTLNPGTDINYFALQSANFTNLFQVPPHLIGLWTRQRLQTDMPSGMYYYDSRNKPINSMNYGNMEMILNPSVVNAGAVLLIAFESMGAINTLVPAGSLPGG